MASRDEMLMNFQAMTGKSDVGECISLLESVDWDLQRAVNQAIEDPEPIEHIPAPEPEPQPVFPPSHIMQHNLLGDDDNPFAQLLDEMPSVRPQMDALQESLAYVRHPAGGVAGGSRIGTSNGTRTSGVIEFTVHHGHIEYNLRINESRSVVDLLAQLAQRVDVPHTHVHLTGWPTEHMPDDHQTLKELALPRRVTLVMTVEEREVEPESKARLQVTDVGKNETFTLLKMFSITVGNVKRDVARLTGIAPQRQLWTGWPPHSDDDTPLSACGLSKPIHVLTVENLPSALVDDSNGGPSNMDVTVESDEDDVYDSHHDLYDDIPTRTTNPSTSSGTPPPNALIVDAQGEVADLCAMLTAVFESRYGVEHPPFFQGDLGTAIAHAHATRLPLFVYLHNDQSIAANVFASQVLCHPDVVTALSGAVLWAWDMTVRANAERANRWMNAVWGEDIRMIQMIPADRFPLLLAFGRLQGNRPQFMSYINGGTAVEQALQKIHIAMNQHQGMLAEEGERDRERQQRENVRLEQASAYEQTLAADKQREMERTAEIKAEAERVAEEKAEEEARIEAETRAANDEEQRRARLMADLPVEPPSTSEKGTFTTIRLRLPGGTSVDRRFAMTDRLEDMFTLCDALGYGSGEYRFLTSDFPKRDLTTMDGRQTMAEVKMPIREQITVDQK